MEVKFENTVVPIWKIRQGTLVKFERDYYYIQYFNLSEDGRFMLTLDNGFEPKIDVNPRFVEWLEPF